MRTGAAMIAAERQRQVEREGWTPEHDDEHGDGELAMAAASYIAAAVVMDASDAGRSLAAHAPDSWPWDESWWKPTGDSVRALVKAGALIAAEIDRLNRAAAAGEGNTDGS